MKHFFLSNSILCFFCLTIATGQVQNIAIQGKITADSYNYDYIPNKAIDGKIDDSHKWLSNAAIDAHWLLIEFDKTQTIKVVDIYSGYKNSSAIENFVLQTKNKGKWQDIEGSIINNNSQNELRIIFPKHIKTKAIRFYTEQPGGNGQVRLREIKLWESDNNLEELSILKFEEEDPLKHNPEFDINQHQVFINQIGFNTHWPKRFTAPISPDGSEYVITPANSDKILYNGIIKDHIGDFSDFTKKTDTYEYCIRINGHNLKPGKSVPFSIKPFLFEEVTFNNAVRHFVDDRSITGSHPGAFGAAPWRDAPFYAYCVPSLVVMYLGNPDFCEQLPVEMNWDIDMQRVLAPGFKFEPGAGENSMEVVERMYKELDGPVGVNVPDVVQLIHWGTSWWYIKPESKDYAGSDYKLHPETISEFAYFLYGYPSYNQYFTDKYYQIIKDYAFDMWSKVGLFELNKTIGTFKGRYTPGWTILPNLMMYEVAKREGRTDAERFMEAAYNQTEWIIQDLDFEDPLVTKGQRMSEHKMMSGLFMFFSNYPERLPEGFVDKIRQWADIAIRRSENYWDFRKFDDGNNWTLPRKMPGHTGGGSSWNEPGNLAGFPSIAWNVNRILGDSPEDMARKKRLNILAVSQIDNLYGRNPLGYHTALRGIKDFKGVEVGWPIKYNPNVCARLHLVRGTICSTAATEHYPFNPNGAFRHPEGWTAFNSSLNMGLIAATRENIKIDIISTYEGLEIKMHAPVFGKKAQLEVTTSSGDYEFIDLYAEVDDNTRFNSAIKTQPGRIQLRDSILQVKKNDTVTVRYGYGYFKIETEIKLD